MQKKNSLNSASMKMVLFSCLTALAGRTRPTLALSVATLSTRSSTAAASRFLSSSGTPNRPAFFRDTHKPFGSTLSTCSSITSLRQSTATVETLKKNLEVTHPAYEVVDKDIVNEYGAYCTLYRHKKSGAELLSVSNDDDNKVFGITFRTPPEDSTGVPHILEHSVLCGSRKYTTKDPFVQLLQGSLQTFLNAFTYPDRTCYVVASQNLKDFYNLINVYTDAVFHPRAIRDKNVHAQEGWHLELEEKEAPLVYKGVVYNEMKGVYSSPDSLLNRESQRSIFPDNTYAVDSGGDPTVIPDLSYEDFCNFHAKFYHPANSRIYFSGDDDVYERLAIMDEYLKDFGDSPESKPGSVIQWQKKRFTEPLKVEQYYPASDGGEDNTHMVQVNWLVNDKPLTPTQELTITVLDHLLLGTTSSVLRKTLMESGLGTAITGGGLSDELLQATFSLGLKGVKEENVEKVEELIMSTLSKVVEEGFTDDAIASSMNTIEFEMREFNTGSFPKGLSFMLGSMSKWVYDESPTHALKFEEPLAELKKSIEESGPKVFEDTIREFLVENKHRSVVEMIPSTTLEKEQLKEEEDRLAKIKSTLGPSDLDEIIKETQTLKQLQASEDSPDDRATIPKLALEDLERKNTEYPIEEAKEHGVKVLRHELGSTSGIAYVDFAVDVSVVDWEDVVLLPLFSRILMETGAGEWDDVTLSRQIGTHTGGIRPQLLLAPVKRNNEDEEAVSDGSYFSTKLFLRGKATSEKASNLFSIMKLVLTEAKLNTQSKIIEMLKEKKAQMEAQIQGGGHQFANTRMKSRYTASGYVEEMLSGVTFLDTVKDLLKQAESDWPAFLARLEKVRNKILDSSVCRDGMVLNLTGDQKVLNSIQPSVDEFLTSLPGNEKDGKKLTDFYSEPHPWVENISKEMPSTVADEGFVVPTQVSYVGKGGLLYKPGEKVTGSAMVVSRFLKTGYLWDHVRVIGGAYGGFCVLTGNDGFFSYLSYRDPNLAKTIDVYDATAEELTKTADLLQNDKEALANAIIGTVGDIDGVKSPDQKGWISMQRWLQNESAERRQRFRDQILNTSSEDFKAFAERLKNLNGSVAVVSSEAAFDDAAKAGKELTIKEVL